MSKCAECSQLISVTDKLNCQDCTKSYHCTCVGLEKDEYKKLSARAKKAWMCLDCVSAKEGVKSPEPPKELDSASSELSSRQTAAIENRLSRMESSMLSKITDLFETTVLRTIRSDLERLRKDVEPLIELKASVELMSEIHDDTVKELKNLRKEVQELRTDNINLQKDVSELHLRIDQMDQHARENNLEIQCLPEFSNENLVISVKQLASAVSCPLDDKEIMSCTRVAKANPSSSRPRSVIVRLYSPRKRDEVLAACLKYNKSKTTEDEKLNSAALGIGGAKQRIYVAEHLSPKNRELQAKARQFKKDKKYSFLWVRNGRILLRKDDKSPAIWVKNLEVLKNLD